MGTGEILVQLGALLDEAESMGLVIRESEAEDVVLESAWADFSRRVNAGEHANAVSDLICELLRYSAHLGLDTDSILSRALVAHGDDERPTPCTRR